MASVALVTSAGISSIATPVKARSTDLITRAGLLSAPSPVSWSGSSSALSRVPWIPKAGTPFLMVDNQGRMLNQVNPAWDRCLRWLFEDAIGGINAPTLPQVRATVTATQAQVVQTTTYAEQIGTYAAGIGSVAQATAEVAQSNGLTGAESIPETPERPQPPGTETL